MMNLMTKAIEKYDASKGIFMFDPLEVAEVVKMEDANAHDKRKEEIHREISCSHSGAASTDHLSSPECASKDPPKEDAELTYVSDEAMEDTDDEV